jgi:CheY-like chemotaxis protein
MRLAARVQDFVSCPMEEVRQVPEVRVLVVDDNVDAATSLGYLLQLMGAKTAVAFGGDMALRLVRLFQPGVVLVDLRMPGMDGLEVLSEARRLPECEPDTLFVCFSASRDKWEQQRCLEGGFDYFIPKPVDPAELAGVLHAAQGRVRAGGVKPSRESTRTAAAAGRRSR